MAKDRKQKCVDLGRAIKRWREEKEMSRQELAQRVGVTTTAILYVENGRSMPRLERLGVYADALGVASSDLLAAAEDESEVVNAANN